MLLRWYKNLRALGLCCYCGQAICSACLRLWTTHQTSPLQTSNFKLSDGVWCLNLISVSESEILSIFWVWFSDEYISTWWVWVWVWFSEYDFMSLWIWFSDYDLISEWRDDATSLLARCCQQRCALLSPGSRTQTLSQTWYCISVFQEAFSQIHFFKKNAVRFTIFFKKPSVTFSLLALGFVFAAILWPASCQPCSLICQSSAPTFHIKQINHSNTSNFPRVIICQFRAMANTDLFF